MKKRKFSIAEIKVATKYFQKSHKFTVINNDFTLNIYDLNQVCSAILMYTVINVAKKGLQYIADGLAETTREKDLMIEIISRFKLTEINLRHKTRSLSLKGTRAKYHIDSIRIDCEINEERVGILTKFLYWISTKINHAVSPL